MANLALKRGRPPTKGKIPPKNKITKLTCTDCHKELILTEFYNSNSKFAQVGKFAVCKTCLRKKIKIDDIQTTYDALMAMDAPFLIEYWEIANASEDVKFPFGNYVRMINTLKQFQGLTWKDSIFEYEAENIKIGVKSREKFVLTDEILDFFGAGYQQDEYEAMFKKYSFLKNNYPETTNMHIEALKTYVIYKVKAEISTAKGEAGEAGKWSDMAQKAAVAAKINPSQMSKSDLQGGLSNFSELIKSVESAVDIIKILPRFKYMPQDAPDFIIYCYVNYARDLKGLPPAKYEDIYQFYDKKKAEYLEQYGDPFGLFEGDLDSRNRDAISKFVMDIIANKQEEDSPEDIFEGDVDNGIA